MTLDARGLACPEPVVMLKKALKTEKNLTVLIDEKGAAENCTNFAKRYGMSVVSVVTNGEYILTMKVKDE